MEIVCILNYYSCINFNLLSICLDCSYCVVSANTHTHILLMHIPIQKHNALIFHTLYIQPRHLVLLSNIPNLSLYSHTWPLCVCLSGQIVLFHHMKCIKHLNSLINLRQLPLWNKKKGHIYCVKMLIVFVSHYNPQEAQDTREEKGESCVKSGLPLLTIPCGVIAVSWWLCTHGLIELWFVFSG